MKKIFFLVMMIFFSANALPQAMVITRQWIGNGGFKDYYFSGGSYEGVDVIINGVLTTQYLQTQNIVDHSLMAGNNVTYNFWNYFEPTPGNYVNSLVSSRTISNPSQPLFFELLSVNPIPASKYSTSFDTCADGKVIIAVKCNQVNGFDILLETDPTFPPYPSFRSQLVGIHRPPSSPDDSFWDPGNMVFLDTISNLSSGKYKINIVTNSYEVEQSVAPNPYRYFQYDTIESSFIIGPACSLNVNMISKKNVSTDHLGSLKLLPNSNDCNGIMYTLTNRAGSLIYSGFSINGDTLFFPDLDTGRYSVTVSLYSNNINQPAIGEACVYKNDFVIGDERNTELHLKLFVQGYYQGNGEMAPALYNSGISGSDISQADSITVELHDPVSGDITGQPVTAVLNTDGTAILTFPPVTTPQYLAVRHRNAIETWSGQPLALNGTVYYDFTTQSSNAYGNNMSDMGGGVYALWSGDINQDGAIESTDYAMMENSVLSILFGYNPTDLNGDGVVESADYALMENNLLRIIFVARPF